MIYTKDVFSSLYLHKQLNNIEIYLLHAQTLFRLSKINNEFMLIP